jgi:pyroglutamyl-peptidase
MNSILDGQSTCPAVLLTGFGPFPGVAANETERLVPALAAAARGSFKNHAIHYAILPTEWSTAPVRLSQLLHRHKPVLALHFGVAQDATGFRIEREGYNSCCMAPDSRGKLPLSLNLIAGGTLCQTATVPVETIVQRLLSLGLPAYSSNDAGRYLCNAVLYHSLSVSQSSQNPFRAGFVHIPADLSSSPLTFNDVLRGSLEILNVCLRPST